MAVVREQQKKSNNATAFGVKVSLSLIWMADVEKKQPATVDAE
jgi:drug/metabolite transporter superfamily protein YnfA